MQKLFNILLCLGLIGCAGPEITKVGNQTYKIVGKLHKEEYDEIITIVNDHQNQPLSFYVTSGGGTSVDLIPAMDAVYQHGSVHWYVVDRCDSACAVMALATRHAHGKIKLHSFYAYHDHAAHAAPEYNEVLLRKLQSYGYDTAQMHHMFDNVEQLWTLTVVDGEIIH